MTKENANNEQKNQFSVMEEDVLNFWEKSNTFKKSVDKAAPNGDYVFYDGPPFITGLPHYATLLPSIAKDIIPRYWTMKGYKVERVWGWDCHGLPAENKVEKELDLKNKKDIEKLGVGKFVDACRTYVDTGSEQWKWYIDRIGRWVDMDNAYKTMDLDFMESTIWAFKKLYDDGFIYEGYRTSLHCPRCATPLSKFEITMDAGSYKDVDDETVVVKFKVKNQENTYLLAWTTTPWTLPGNLALAVGEDIDYVKVKVDINSDKMKAVEVKPGHDVMESATFSKFEEVILAKDMIEKVLVNKYFEILEEFKGKELKDIKYEPIFDLKNKELTDNEKTFKVYPADFVTTEEGTGIVHIAPNFGEDDFNLGQEVGLPMIDLMDENGIYTEEAGEWSGEYFKKVNTRALEELGDKKFLQETHKHSYPFCYRCNTRLIHKTQKAWYLKIDKIRQKMLDNNKKDINWVPDYFKEGRFHNNIESAPDWCLSRSRYWGSPIPVWKCEECGELKVAGSLEEIKKESGVEVDDLHRPKIDEVEFKCSCGGKMKRVPEVLDCWFESGSMPFAQFHYPFNETRKKEWGNIFPADFIIEYTGQLRGWFYYLHVLSNALFDSVAFKNVIVTGVLAGTDGRKMSKSFGNYPDPKATLDKYGSDALRIYFMGSPIMVGGDMSLSEKDIQDALRKNVILLWNVVKFFSLFNEENKLNINDDLKEQVYDSENILDKWILIRFNELHKEIQDNLEKYNLPGACRPITQFIDDLSTWYLRRSRDRFKGVDEADKNNALAVTGYVLLKLSKVIAPIMPFISEQVWQKVTNNNFSDKNESVHLEEWPEIDEVFNQDILDNMRTVKELAEIGLAKRDEAKIKVRQPLSKFILKGEKSGIFKIKDDQAYLDILKDEINVKEIIFEESDSVLDYKIDTELTEELKLEGNKRELVRFINNMRKFAGLSIGDYIEVYWSSESEDIKKTIDSFSDEIKNDTLTREIKEGNYDSEATSKKTVKVNGIEVDLEIIKL